MGQKNSIAKENASKTNSPVQQCGFNTVSSNFTNPKSKIKKIHPSEENLNKKKILI